MQLPQENTKLVITVTCLPGLEEILAEEIQKLGGEAVDIRRRAVVCQGDMQCLYALNIYCRYALRVLLHLRQCKIRNEEDMYHEMGRIDWAQSFDADKTLAIRTAFGRHQFKNTHYFALKAKDAIVDQFNKEFNRRPSIDTKKPDIGVYLHYDAGELNIYLDSSGYSLHKRGYKKNMGRATLSETLAAALFRWAEWQPGQTVINPMCGAGTLAIEAGFTMLEQSPQLLRHQFGFRSWKDYDDDLYQSLRQEGSPKEDLEIYCSDIDERTVNDCRDNVEEANLEAHIHCDVDDFFEMDPIPNSIVLLNPPYDKRLVEEDVIGFYKKIGDTLKFNWKSTRCVIISANLEAFKFIGLRPNKKYKVYNGPLPAEVRVYDIY